LTVWEDLFRKNLPIPTEEGGLAKFKSVMEKFSSLVKRAIVGRNKLKNLQKIQGENDRTDFFLSNEEQSAITSMQSLIPVIEITPRLLELETGIEAYLDGKPVKPVRMRSGNSLIKTV